MVQIFNSMRSATLIFYFLLFTFYFSSAQDTLPKFTVIDKGNNRIQIKWINPYHTCNQMLIQRSFDSSKNFKTIFTVSSPNLPVNGYVDNAAPINNMYYRIFYVLEGGNYFFSVSQRPIQLGMYSKKDTASSMEYTDNRQIVIQKGDNTIRILDIKQFQRFRDSMLVQTKDTLFSRTFDTIVIKPFIPKAVFIPSIYVFTEKEGYVKIVLPDANEKHYRIRFYEMDSSFLFEIKRIKASFLIVDKTNFVHAGWFMFELYEDDKLKEKNKVHIPKDF